MVDTTVEAGYNNIITMSSLCLLCHLYRATSNALVSEYDNIIAKLSLFTVPCKPENDNDLGMAVMSMIHCLESGRPWQGMATPRSRGAQSGAQRRTSRLIGGGFMRISTLSPNWTVGAMGQYQTLA